jgi:hypothetical protein
LLSDMATLPSIFSISSSSSLPLHRFRPSISLSFPSLLRSNPTKSQSRSSFLVLASSTHHSFDDFTSNSKVLAYYYYCSIGCGIDWTLNLIDYKIIMYMVNLRIELFVIVIDCRNRLFRSWYKKLNL